MCDVPMHEFLGRCRVTCHVPFGAQSGKNGRGKQEGYVLLFVYRCWFFFGMRSKERCSGDAVFILISLIRLSQSLAAHKFPSLPIQ